MSEHEILGQLQEIFRDVLLLDDLVLHSETARTQVQGWDSMRQIDLVLSVETHFSIRFSSREIDRLACVGDFVSLVMQKVR